MKRTLLEMVQDILNDLDSDEVATIEDTVESQQVAQILRTTYYELISNRNWPHTRKLIQLEASNTLDKPNYLKLPENIKELSMFKYDSVKEGSLANTLRDIKYLHPEDFLRRVSARSPLNLNQTEVVDFSGSILYIADNKAPNYWTSFDDNYLVTDSYDKSVDDTLQSAKTQALAYLFPRWEATDLFIPDLPAEAFSLLIEEAKSAASLALKQLANQKAEQRATRQNRWLSRKAWQAAGGVRFPNYGRKGRK